MVFQALTRQAVSPQFLGYDLKPHQAVVKIPEPRLTELGRIWGTRLTTPATMEFVDIPGFDPALTEAKLKNAVLEHYRRCDALALIAALFDPAKAEGAAAANRALLDELTLLDLVTVESVAGRLKKAAQLKADQLSVDKYAVLTQIQARLEEGTPIRRMSLSDEQRRLTSEYGFLSDKPVIVVLNVTEDDFGKDDAALPGTTAVLKLAAQEQLGSVRLAASLEAELAEMDEAEAPEYMAEFGISEPVLNRFIRAAYGTLGLITFLTASDKECRSWPLKKGSNAHTAAGVIHSDMARGFIRAETVAFDDYVQYGGLAGAKSAGKVRLEGKEYIVQDGDILQIRFNV